MSAAQQKINSFRVNVLERTLYSVAALYIVGLLMRAWFAPIKPLAFTIMIVIGCLLAALGYSVRQLHIPYRYAANIFLMLMVLSVTLMLIYGSGFRGPVTAVLILVPIYASFFLGIRPGQQYGLGVLIILTLSYCLDAWGFQPANALQINEYVDAKYIVFCAIILGSMIVVSAYEGNRDRTEKYLGQLNRELERSRQKLQESLSTKSRFVANMSHEVRTPLNAILGFVALLKEDIDDDKKRGQLGEIERAAEILLSIVNDVLDASKLESGKVELESQPFEPIVQVRHVIEMLRLQAEVANIAVSLDVKSGVPPQIVGDPVRFSQIVINLVGNAIKFSDGNDVLVELEIQENRSEEPSLQVNVIDRGIGLTEEAVDKLFQPFVQADASTTRKYGGTGLGLSICRGIVEQMGGSIWVESKINEGSKFSFALPLQQVAAEQARTSQADHQRPEAADSTDSVEIPSRILVAEDNKTNRTIVEAFLARLGHSADYVDTGREAVAAVKEKRYDVLLMDCHMPELDGYAATREIIDSCGNDRPRIIAFTANSSEEDRRRCELAGMDGFVGKPLRLAELRDALH